jgi:DNA-binding transcriptional MerR regulator
MLELPVSLLRFWEKEFQQFVKPRKTKGGTRKYSKADIETIALIKQLVKVEGYTLDGAREKLKLRNKVADKTAIVNHLNDLKLFLTQLQKKL